MAEHQVRPVIINPYVSRHAYLSSF